jgi:hypothetical protein
MMTGNEWLSPTRMTGLLSYATAFGACAWRWFAEGRRGRPSGEFLLLAVAQLGLVLDIALDIRWKLHDFWMTRATEMHLYSERRGPQLVALVLLVGLLLVGVVWIPLRFRGRRGLALALSGTMLSIGLWFCEMLSYHFMDAVLYSMAGKLMLVSFLWVVLAMTTCSGVWLETVS